MLSLILTLLAVACPAHAKLPDDTAENLATDLAPFLSLFGEKMLLHWISQSVTHFEVLVIAICPIGVPALIISALRLAGSQRLRNMIGRPRESRPFVESELTPSTSDEVSECWDGHRVVRTIGDAKTQEYFILKRAGASSTDRIVVKKLSECVGTYIEVGDVPAFPGKMYQILKSTFNSLTRHLASINPSSLLSAIGRYTRRSSSPSDVEHSTVPLEDLPSRASGSPQMPHGGAGDDAGVILIKNDKTKSPNLSLNIQEHLHPKFGDVYLLLALAGFLFGLVCPWVLVGVQPDWVKDDKETRAWKVIYGIGSFGMFICSFMLGYIILQCTAVVVYRPAPGWQLDRQVWLQGRSTINYQHFLPHAIFPTRPKDYIVTTERRELSRSLTKYCNISSICCVAAFILELFGLRGMHPGLQLVHIGALLVMTAIRYCINDHLARRPSARPLTSGFEMDWLSMIMAKGLQDAPWSQTLEARPHAEPDRSDRPWAANGGWDWKSPSWEDLTKCVPLISNAPLDSTARPSKAQEVLNLRKGIAKAGATPPPLTTLAVSVALAIEGTLRTLTTSDEGYLGPGCRSLLWKIGSCPDDVVEIRMNLDESRKKWNVPVGDLEAMLSLWSFKTSSRDEARGMQPTAEAGPVGEGILTGPPVGHASVGQEDEWLRKHSKKHTFLSPMPSEGNPLPALFQGINLWFNEPFRDTRQFGLVALEHGISSLEPSQRRSSASPAPFSHRGPSVSTSSGMPGRHLAALGEVKTLVQEPEGSLQTRLAQHLFGLFMWSLSKTLKKPIGGEAEVVDVTGGSLRTRCALDNSCLRQMSTQISLAGLGEQGVVFPALLLPLLAADKLPSYRAIFEAAGNRHDPYEQRKLSDTNTHIYIWLFFNLLKLPTQKDLFIKVATVLINSLEHMHLDHGPDKATRSAILFTLAFVLKITRTYIGDPVWKIMKRVVSVSESHDARFSIEFNSASELPGLESISEHLVGSTPNPMLPHHQLSPLQLFCLNGEDLSEERVIEVIRDNVNYIDSVDVFGRAAIHYAIQRDHSRRFELVSKLISSGAKTDIPDLLGRTPLHLACHYPGVSVPNKLLMCAFDPFNMPDLNGLAPWQHAAAWGVYSVIRCLRKWQDRGINTTRFGVSELVHFYARYREPGDLISIMRFELDLMRLHDNRGRNLFHLAVINPKFKPVDIPLLFTEYYPFKHRDSFLESPIDLARRIGRYGCGHACSAACKDRMHKFLPKLEEQLERLYWRKVAPVDLVVGHYP